MEDTTVLAITINPEINPRKVLTPRRLIKHNMRCTLPRHFGYITEARHAIKTVKMQLALSLLEHVSSLPVRASFSKNYHNVSVYFNH